MDYVISGLGVIGLAVVGTRRRLGWLIGASSQTMLIIYGVWTEQYGFVIFPPMIIVIQLWNVWRWRKEGWRRLDPRRPCRCQDHVAQDLTQNVSP